jgi:hypothetical protein
MVFTLFITLPRAAVVTAEEVIAVEADFSAIAFRSAAKRN